MFEHFGRIIGWNIIRLAITFAGILTVQRLAETEGRPISLGTLTVGAAVVIICTKLWNPQIKG